MPWIRAWRLRDLEDRLEFETQRRERDVSNLQDRCSNLSLKLHALLTHLDLRIDQTSAQPAGFKVSKGAKPSVTSFFLYNGEGGGAGGSGGAGGGPRYEPDAKPESKRRRK